MTAKELIEKLQELPPDMPVLFIDQEVSVVEICDAKVETYEDHEGIFLEWEFIKNG